MTLAFDLDGTLISCEPRQSAVLQAALVENGAVADVERVWKLKREGATTKEALLELGLDSAKTCRVSEDWGRMIEEPAWLALDSVLPGVLETLNSLCKMGITVWVITSRSRREWVCQQLKHLGLMSFLNHIVVVSPGEVIKAKARVLRKGSPAAFFGDTEADWQASLAACIPFYPVATGQRSSSFLTRSGITPAYSGVEAACNAFLKAINPGV